MELTFAEQSTAFVYSVILGIALAVVYGVFKFLRYAFSYGRAAVFVTDFLFMLIWAFSIFFFSLAYLSGYVRIYVFFGSLAGLALYRTTIGRLSFRVYRPIISFLRALFHKFCTKVKLIAKKLLKIACKILYNISKYKDDFKSKRKSSSNKRKKYETEKTKDKKGRYSFRCRHFGKRRPKGNSKA